MINPSAVGASTNPTRRSWTSTDALLYALGVGAGHQELAFTTENSHELPQQVLPTFGVIIASSGKSLRLIGDFDLGRLVHGAQSTTVYRPIPVEGTIEVIERVTDLQDKGDGKHAIVESTASGYDVETGELLVEIVASAVLRGQGGFGGSPGTPAPLATQPDRAPDVQISYPTTLDTPLLYRLSGDRNPLHSDPWFARNRAGFDAPIMHGLCTYGFAGRALVHGVCDSDPDAFGSMSVRFATPAYPGDTLTTSIWRTPDGAYFHTADAASGRTLLSGGRFTFRHALATPPSRERDAVSNG